MLRAAIAYADTPAEAATALADLAPGTLLAVFSRRAYEPPAGVRYFRVRAVRNPQADLAAMRAELPRADWRLAEPVPSPTSAPRPSPPHHPEEDPALSPTAPTEGAEIAVVTCHWNFAGYRTPTRNLLRFLREMDAAGIPVYGMELHLPGDEPAMAANPRWTVAELGPDQILWQKEAAMNRVALSVPDHIPCIAAVDADLRFEDPAWAGKTVAALRSSPAAQPFTEAVWVDESGRVDLRRACCARDGLDGRWRTHPGFAWAFRREFFVSGPGFYPWCISGAGDTASAAGLLGVDPTAVALAAFGPRNLGPGRAATRWLAAAEGYMDGRGPGWVEGRVWHEWHGSRADRRYVERHRHMRHVEVGRHIEMGDDGLLRWTAAATRAMREGVARYFHQRKEDG